MRFNFVVFLTALVLLIIGSVTLAMAQGADTTVLGVKIPAWLQQILGIGGTAGGGALAVWAVVKAKLGKYYTLFENCKVVISETIDLVHYVRDEVKNEAAKKEWNEFIDSVAKTLIDTGNASLVQKGNSLLKAKL